MKKIVIDGNRFDDEESFYNEIDRLLTRNLTWKTGHNLDAFNDLLCGGFGFHEYGEELIIVWVNALKSKTDLGYEETVRHWERILLNCHPSNIEYVQKKIQDARNQTGETLFDIIIHIITDSDESGHDCKLELAD
ncbi:MAG: barstar family protein [Clostridiales bacterium]|nr:barstar family protein [Clostridiales bacterium]